MRSTNAGRQGNATKNKTLGEPCGVFYLRDLGILGGEKEPGLLVGNMERKMGLDFDPIDMEQMRLVRKLSVGQRIQRLLHARALAAGLIRGRLRRRYPNLTARELNTKLVEELDRI